MRVKKFSELIRISLDHTEAILFKPFHVKRWLAFLFIAWLAGALGGSYSGQGLPNVSPSQEAETTGQDNDTQSDEVVDEAGETYEETGADDEALLRTRMEEAAESISPVWYIVLAVAVLALFLALGWLNARFQFVWYEAVVTKSPSVKAPFIKYRAPGNSYFILSILLTLGAALYFACVVLIGVLLGRFVGAFGEGFEWTIGTGVIVFGLPMLVGMVSFATMIIVFVCVGDFVQPIMAIDACTFKKASGSFFRLYLAHKKDMWMYILVKLGLGMLTGLMQFMLLIGWLIVTLLVGAAVFGLPYLLLVTWLNLNMIFGILAVLAAIPFVLLSVLTVISIALPFAVFHRSFSLYFLSSLKSPYTPIALP